MGKADQIKPNGLDDGQVGADLGWPGGPQRAQHRLPVAAGGVVEQPLAAQHVQRVAGPAQGHARGQWAQ